MEQKHNCKFCGKNFHKESTLATHLCIKKQRHLDINTQGSRFGLMAFRRFYELTSNSRKPKTSEDFIESPYYIDFVKFGNHLANLKPLNIELFIEYVIKGQVKLKDWTNDDIYYLYIEDLIKKEPAASATDRTITEIIKWADENNTEFVNFFSDISANEAAHLMRTGKISPWVLYLSSTGGNLLDRFNDDHAKMIASIIDAGFWMKKFKKAGDDVEYIRGLMSQVAL